MNKSESIKELASALNRMQGELKNAPQNSVNPFFKSKYTDLSTLIDHARTLLTKNGLAIVQGNEMSENGIVITTLLTHESGEWIESQLYMPIEERSAQKIGGVITYGRRYAYSAMLGIASEEDDDGNYSSRSTKPQVSVSEAEQIFTQQPNGKCPVCNATGKYHRPDCPNK